MMSPNLQHFEIFLRVAELASFTQAANELGLSKAAISHSIHVLEKSLQIPLFIRTTRKIELTEEGQLLFKQCLHLKEELDLTRSLITNFKTSPSGILKISCNPYFAETYLLRALALYIEKYPEVSIEVLAEERMPDMEREKVDIVFGINWPAPLDVVAKVIGKTRYVLCASPDYLKKFGIPKTINDLEQHTYIQHLGRTPKNALVNLKKPVSLKLNSPLKFNNAQLMKQCALNGLGIIQLHDYMVKEELLNGSLVELLANYFKPDIPIYVYYQKHRYVQPKIRLFVNLLKNLN